ncbi:YrdB family protein [Fodinicola feengrottensis]|uniref:YrdB family protein n=1 Tax=Fodinicola feengrottensis TaxID=435914 RepID=UPI002443041D|nr:YrdB family protein [Fodinicola feengrottensis]
MTEVLEKINNPPVRAVLEICALVSLGLVGFQFGPGLIGSLVFAALLPVAAAVAWAMFCSPKATMPLSLAGRITVEAVIFGCAAVGLALTGRLILIGGLFAIVALLSGAFKHYIDG